MNAALKVDKTAVKTMKELKLVQGIDISTCGQSTIDLLVIDVPSVVNFVPNGPGLSDQDPIIMKHRPRRPSTRSLNSSFPQGNLFQLRRSFTSSGMLIQAMTQIDHIQLVSHQAIYPRSHDPSHPSQVRWDPLQPPDHHPYHQMEDLMQT